MERFHKPDSLEGVPMLGILWVYVVWRESSQEKGPEGSRIGMGKNKSGKDVVSTRGWLQPGPTRGSGTWTKSQGCSLLWGKGARFMILISVNHWLMAIPDNEGRQFWGRMYNLPGRFAFTELKETLQWKPLSV